MHCCAVVAAGRPHTIQIAYLCAVVIGHTGLPGHDGGLVLVTIISQGGGKLTHQLVAHHCHGSGTGTIAAFQRDHGRGKIALASRYHVDGDHGAGTVDTGREQRGFLRYTGHDHLRGHCVTFTAHHYRHRFYVQQVILEPLIPGQGLPHSAGAGRAGGGAQRLI